MEQSTSGGISSALTLWLIKRSPTIRLWLRRSRVARRWWRVLIGVPAPDLTWAAGLTYALGLPLDSSIPRDQLNCKIRLLATYALWKKISKVNIYLFHLAIRALKVTFAPKLLLKRLILVAGLQILTIVSYRIYSSLHYIFYEMGSQKYALRQKMKVADTYSEWARLAAELDTLVGNDKWKNEKRAPYFDWQLIEKKTRYLQQLIASKDVDGLMWNLRKGLLRRQGGVGHPELFSHTYVGTKKNVEEYINTVCNALQFILRSPTIEEQNNSESGDDRWFGSSMNYFSAETEINEDEEDEMEEDIRTREMEKRDLYLKRKNSQNLHQLSKQEEEDKTGNENQKEKEKEEEEKDNNNKKEKEKEDEFTTLPSEVQQEETSEEEELPTSRDLTLEMKLRFFQETRHSLGRSALLLSGGITLGLYHMGVVKVLYTHGLLPRVISGSSAGSVVAGILGCLTDDEIPQTFEDGYLDLNFFEKIEEDAKHRGFFERSSFFRRVKRFVTQGTILDVNILKATIRGNIGEMTFLEAYERTGRIINISVTPASKNEYPTLLNYLTAPHVLIWSACLASCAIPYVFDSIALMAKDKDGNIEPYYPEGLKWQDGSLEYDLPMTRLSELFNVNHFIVSQVNPHVIPFSTIGWQGNLLTKLIHYLKAELKHYGANIASLGLPIPGISFFAIFTQKYEGDITIKPLKTNFKNFQGLLSNPTRAKVAAAIREGERKTWRHLSMIRNHCDIEFTLNECVNEVKRQLYQRMEQEEDPTKKRRVRRIRRESWMRRRGSSVISFMDEPRPK